MKAKAFLLFAFAALCFSSCNVNVKDITSAAKEEYKAQHEYRDSRKWGKVTDKIIETENFTSLSIKGNVDIVFTQNDTLSVKAYGNEKAIAQYDISAIDGKLSICLKDYDKKQSVNKNTPAITVFVNAPELEKIESFGAGDIKLCGKINEECGLDIDISGAGDIDANKLKLANLSVTINGAGDLDIEKAECTGNADFTINGAGSIDAEVKCTDAELTINGAGDAELNVKCDELTAACNGAGDVKLKGECNKLNKKDGAISSIDSRNLKVNNKVNVKK